MGRKKEKINCKKRISIKIYDNDVWGLLKDFSFIKHLKYLKKEIKKERKPKGFSISEYVEKIIEKDLSKKEIEKKKIKTKTSSIFIRKDLWIPLKNYCKNEGKEISKYLYDLIIENLDELISKGQLKKMIEESKKIKNKKHIKKILNISN